MEQPRWVVCCCCLFVVVVVVVVEQLLPDFDDADSKHTPSKNEIHVRSEFYFVQSTPCSSTEYSE
jgi:hypothetical protein